NNVPAGPQTVSARSIGYTEETVEVAVSAGEVAQANFQLAAHAVLVDGIVVVGYGTQSRELVTGAVATVSGDDLEAVPTTNLSNALGGRPPGVVAVNPSGEPGANGSTIRI